ncbi:MAG: AAA family ATPase [Candidatus Micrarchaeota archaeon]
MKLVLGFAGLFASGKSTAARYAAKTLRCRAFSLGDEVRFALKKKNRVVTREALQELSTEEKKKFGDGIWAKRLVARIKKAKAKTAVVEGFRNLDEVRVFRRAFKKFVLIAVTAPIGARYRRAKRRMRENERVASLAAFKRSEAREAKGAGWGIAECVADADLKTSNTGSEAQLKKKVAALAKRVRQRS